MTLYKLTHFVLKCIINVFLPYRIHGKENIPEDGAVICANHAHNTDPLLIVLGCLSRNASINVMAKEEILHWPIVGSFLNKLHIVIWVKRGKADVGAIKGALRCLKANEKLLIFPEGTRNEELGEGKTGAAMLAIRTKTPVLPIYIETERRRFRRVNVYVGKPFHPFTEDRKATQDDYQTATEVIMGRIRDLMPEEAV